jgi:hypothetical protein
MCVCVCVPCSAAVVLDRLTVASSVANVPPLRPVKICSYLNVLNFTSMCVCDPCSAAVVLDRLAVASSVANVPAPGGGWRVFEQRLDALTQGQVRLCVCVCMCV